MNSFVKSGKDNTGAVHKDNFSSSNTFFVASRQVKAFFFNILVKGLAAFTYGINYVGPKGKDNTWAVHKDNFSSSNTFFCCLTPSKGIFLQHIGQRFAYDCITLNKSSMNRWSDIG
nr:hypothetical protein Iba_chr12bCG16620 [Ipomoea batatas]